MPTVSYDSIPFVEQAEFFRRKLNMPTKHWTDIYNAEHDWAFMVAGASRDEIVQDFREAIEKAIVDGTTIQEFRKDFDSIVAQYGWDYNGGRDWRSRVIYETNLYSSHAAGRYEQLKQSAEHLPYWEYHHSDTVEHPRLEHLSWDGLILRHDDPWWNIYFPINAWGCHCYVTAHSQDGLHDLGKSRPDTAPEIEWLEREIGQRSPDGPRFVKVPVGIDPGFEHAPGRTRLASSVPPERPAVIGGSSSGPGLPNRRPSDPLPPARSVNRSQLLAEGLQDTDYVQAFLDMFDASTKSPVLFRDVAGESLVVGSDLFTNRRTGELKANKNGRGKYMRLLAQAIIDPDEIWTRIEYHGVLQKAVVRRRYLARYIVPGEDVETLAVWEHSKSGWTGITTFANPSDIEAQRVGVRIYKRRN